jgi:integrase
LLPALGDQKLCEIARFQVQQFIGNKQRQGYSPQTLRHFRNLLSKIFGTAQRWGWMESNPAHQIDLPPMARRIPKRVLTPEQFSWLSSTLAEPVRTIVLLGALTGLRIGKLLALEVDEVDLNCGMVSVRRDVYRGRIGTPKTPGSERQVPLATPLIPILNDWLAVRPSGSSWLFPSATGTPLLDRNLMRRHWWSACEKLDIPRFGWHSLRHTLSTYNGNAGVAMPVLQSLLGHSSPETTMIYTHPLEDAKRQAVEHLARIFFPNVILKRGTAVEGSKLLN